MTAIRRFPPYKEASHYTTGVSALLEDRIELITHGTTAALPLSYSKDALCFAGFLRFEISDPAYLNSGTSYTSRGIAHIPNAICCAFIYPSASKGGVGRDGVAPSVYLAWGIYSPLPSLLGIPARIYCIARLMSL